MTNDIRSIHSVEFENFYYVVTSDGVFGKGCSRCGGTGHYSFNGMDSICYKCNNVWEERLGDIFDNEVEAQKWCHGRAVRKAQGERAREAKRMIEVRALEAKVAALPEDVREFLTAVELNEFDGEMDYYAGNRNENYESDPFIRSMAEQVQFVTHARRPFTEKMVEAVRRNLAKRAEKAAADAKLPAFPQGRVAVTGTVKSVKYVDSDFGGSWKGLVELESGLRIYGTIPTNILEQYTPEELAGVVITFSATLEQSRNDAAFGFWKRPTKASVVS